MSALMEIWHAIQAVVTSADYYTLGIAVVIILAAGFLMESIGSVINVTLVSLIVFVLAKFGLALATGHHVDPEAQVSLFWQNFVDLKMLTLVAYILIFGVLIGIVNAIRSIFR